MSCIALILLRPCSCQSQSDQVHSLESLKDCIIGELLSLALLGTINNPQVLQTDLCVPVRIVGMDQDAWYEVQTVTLLLTRTLETGFNLAHAVGPTPGLAGVVALGLQAPYELPPSEHLAI